MSDLNIALILLDLSKKESQVFLTLYSLYEADLNCKRCLLKDIAKLSGMGEATFLDVLNKLIEKNIVGKITYKGVIDKDIVRNFDDSFLSVLYDKDNPLESAVEKVRYCIDDVQSIYVLNPVIKSWIYVPKIEVIRKLKRLKKYIDSEFISYLLKSLEDNKRKESSASKMKWNTYQVMEKFRSKYKSHYGSDYTANKADYAHMKRLLTQLSSGNLESDKLYIFFDYAFDKAKSKEYVLQVFGLKYYANEYLTNFVKNRVGSR